MIHHVEVALVKLRRLVSRSEWYARLVTYRLARRGRSVAEPVQGTHAEFRTGLILVQIDGLSRRELEAALARGDMPFLSGLRSREHYQLQTLYSGLPSSTRTSAWLHSAGGR